MTDSFFLEADGDSIEFKSVENLLCFLKDKDFTHDARIKNNLSDDKGERVSLKIYLITLAINNLLQFPLNIRKHESPDFILQSNITEIGVEITQNIPTELGKDHSIMSKNPDKFIIEFGPKGHDLKPRDKPLDLMPTYGNQDIDKYVDLNRNAVLRKLNKLNNDTFCKCKINALLILDEYGEPIANKKHRFLLDSLSHDLRVIKNTQKHKYWFQEISFIKGGKLYYNLEEKPELYDYGKILL